MWFKIVGWTLVGLLLLNAFTHATGRSYKKEPNQAAKGILAFILIGYALWTIFALLGGI